MDDEDQVVNLFDEIDQLGTFTVELGAITKQEKPVELQESPETEERSGSHHKVEEIHRKDGQDVQEEPDRLAVMLGQLAWVRHYVAINKETRTKLNDDIQQEDQVEHVVKDQERRQVVLLEGEKRKTENQRPVVIQDSQNH